MDKNPARPPIPALTGMRFYAAGFIVIAHTITFYFQNDTQVHFLSGAWRIANLGMTLFFVLSGFVIHYNYGTIVSAFKLSGIRSFFSARIARLYPLYLFAFAIDIVQYGPSTFSSGLFGKVWPYYLTLTQNWLPLHVDGTRLSEVYIGGAWSISAELALYAGYLIAARPLSWLRTSRGILIVIGILSVAATALQVSHSALNWPAPSDDRWWFYLSPICRLPEFMLGALCAELVIQRAALPSTSRESKRALALPITAMVWITTIYAATNIPSLAQYANTFQECWGLAPPAGMLIYFFARYRTPLNSIVENKMVILLGDASYSIYLLHPWIIWLFAHQQVPINWFAYFRIGVTWMTIALLSLGCYQYFEVPTRSFVRGALGGRASRRATLPSSLHWQPLLASHRVLIGVFCAVSAIAGAAVTIVVVAMLPPTSGIRIVSATYGLNCGVSAGNATDALKIACNGRYDCSYRVDVSLLGDPAAGCQKSFTAEYECMPALKHYINEIPAEAGLGSNILLSCPSPTSSNGRLSSVAIH